MKTQEAKDIITNIDYYIKTMQTTMDSEAHKFISGNTNVDLTDTQAKYLAAKSTKWYLELVRLEVVKNLYILESKL